MVTTVVAKVKFWLTISLCSFDFLQQALEPTEGRRVTANPEEFDATQTLESVALLTVPHMFQNGCKRRDTYSIDGPRLIPIHFKERIRPTNASTNKDSNLSIEDVFRRCTIRSINPQSWKRDGRIGSIQFYEVTLTLVETFLFTHHCILGHGTDHGRTNAESLSERLSPITNLTDVNGYVGVLRG